MQEYLDIIVKEYQNYSSYLWREITNPHFNNYFYWLLIVSGFFFLLEVMRPWRNKQATFRKDFWLDFFYMFFNFFLFSLIIYQAASGVVVHFFNDLIISIFNFDLQAVNPLNNLPMWSILIIGFLVRDFVQWWTHRLLHKSKFLWEFHKVHHSVEEMGFAAHLRYHWMENVVYRTLEYLPLALLGIDLGQFFIIHIFTLSVGHFNHSNVTVSGRIMGLALGLLIGLLIATSSADISLLIDPSFMTQALTILGSGLLGYLILGPIMKLLFNHPEMHIWHHAYELPEDRKTGVNFGLTLAIWDFIFGTVYMPFNGRDIRLGFPEVESFPKGFLKQSIHGLHKEK